MWRPRGSLEPLRVQFGGSRVSQVETSIDTVWPIECTSLTFVGFSLLFKGCFEILLGRYWWYFVDVQQQNQQYLLTLSAQKTIPIKSTKMNGRKVRLCKLTFDRISARCQSWTVFSVSLEPILELRRVGCSFGVHVVFSWRWDVRPSQDAPRVPSNFGKTTYLIDEIRLLDDANYLQPNRGRFTIGHMASPALTVCGMTYRLLASSTTRGPYTTHVSMMVLTHHPWWQQLSYFHPYRR